MDKALKQEFIKIVGVDYVLTDASECAYFSQDVYSRSEFTSALVAQPADIDELSKVVAAATGGGFAVFPRGGGLSYTGGYLPSTNKSVSIDTSRMNNVVEVNTEDMYVTVQAGCTWAGLHKALKAKGSMGFVFRLAD